MNESMNPEKIPYQLGLPPMELAETSDRDSNVTKRCLLHPLNQKIIAIIIIILCMVGAYILLITLFQGFDCGSTEIVILNQDATNVTIEQENIEIIVKFKNVTRPDSKRFKRDVSETTAILISDGLDTFETTENYPNTVFDTKDVLQDDDVFDNVEDEKIQKAREFVMQNNEPCDSNNHEQVCKNLVITIKSLINKDENHDQNEPENTFSPNAPLNIIVDGDESAGQKSATTSVKRETNLLADQELLKPTPNLPFEARDSEPLLASVLPAPVVPYPTVHGPPQIADSCLLAKLLKQQFPHAYHDISEYSPPHFESHSRFVQPVIPPPLFQPRVADNILHHQDAEIFMKFFTQTSTERTSNSSAREADCAPGNIPCSDGEGCILEIQWCDGNVDCSDVSDESGCSCRSRVDKSRLCDGYFDCPFGEDEMGCDGCIESLFSCVDLDENSQSTCFTKEQRCNNVADCPNRRDEMDCTMLSPTLHKTALFAVSNTEGFLHRNFRGDWYAVCNNPYMWAHDACRKETGLIIRPPFIQVLPIDPRLNVNYLNTGEGGLIHMSNTCFNNSAIYVTCPDLLCGTRIMPSAQILREKIGEESRLFGRNKRLSLNHLYPNIFYNKLVKRHLADTKSNPLNSVNTEKDNNNLRNKRTQSRVVGGRPSQPADWPWMVAMYRDGMFHCGGVVLTQRWVVSAAHCMHKYWNHYFEVRVGMLRRFSFSPQEANHRVTHVIVNQKYKKEDMKNDLSLLKVTPAIQFSRWVRPICLPGLETAGPDWLWGPPEGTMCTAVGWGATVEHGPDPDHLREVEVPIWAHCKHREDREGKEICAGLNDGGRDACQGDSGGPLLCKNPHNPHQWYMAGIVSHGDGCGRKDEPGVYTRVSIFVKWIRYHMFSNILPSVLPKQECPGFKCLSGMAKCLPSKRVCDKIVDCLGGEDEINCSSMKSAQDNIFLSTPLEKANTLNENIKTKEAELKPDVTERTTRKVDIDMGLTFFSTEQNIEENKNIESELTQLSTSQKKNTEDENILGSSETIEPFQTTHNEVEKVSRGDMDDSISMSLPQKSLDSMSFTIDKTNTRESDIQEDWNDEFTTAKTPESTTISAVVSESTKIFKEMVVSSATLKITNKLHSFEQSTVVGITGPESKDSLIDLDLSTSVPHINQETNTETIPQKDIAIPDNANSRILPDLENDQTIIDKIKNIVSLTPAKMKRQHRLPKEFECRHIQQVIPYHQRCDRKADCEDGTDELGCSCVDYLSRFDQHLLCDGVFDCADGQDEIDCYSCPEDHFLCKRSQQCVPLKYVCDEKPQCPLGEDELECFALTNGQNIVVDIDGTPKISLQGFLTKKHNKDWHVVCDENLTTEQQEQTAGHICHYLGFSSANRFNVKHINIKEELLLKSSLDEDARNRRNIENGLPVHFAFRKAEDTARHIVIKEPEVLKEQCVPNVTKTCMSLYVYCDHALFTDNFDIPNEILYNREANEKTHMWPWVAKVFVDGEYRCSGVLIDVSWTLISHACVWDVLLSHHFVTVALGSHRTQQTNKGMYEQVYKVDTKKDLYHTKAVLLHLNEPAVYSNMVKPMITSIYTQDEKPSVCLAIGQDEKNKTVGMFIEETNENCNPHNRCFVKTQKENVCTPGMESRQPWAGVISCHSEQGWYPAATFVDRRGECGIGNRIVGSEIGSLKNEMKHFVGRTASESSEINSLPNCDGVRCGRGKCISLSKVCDGVMDCEDQKDELEDSCQTKMETCKKQPYQRGCDCSSGQFKCHNGRCIGKEFFKDGHDDCGDGTDEPRDMSCAHYLAKVKPSRLCDGILNCKDRSDEDPMFCKCFAKKGFRCNKTPSDVNLCVSFDVVCDGVNDCPNGEDEKTCLATKAPVGSKYGTGQVMKQSHGVWHTKCYSTQNHTRSELEAICRELGFISGHAKQLEPPPNFSKALKYTINEFSEVMLNNKTSVVLRNTDEPLAKAVPVDSMENCYPVYIECL